MCVCYSYIDISRHVLCSPRNARVICNMYVDLCVYLDIYIGNPWVCPSWICALPGDVVEDGISGVLRMEDQGSCPHDSPVTESWIHRGALLLRLLRLLAVLVRRFRRQRRKLQLVAAMEKMVFTFFLDGFYTFIFLGFYMCIYFLCHIYIYCCVSTY